MATRNIADNGQLPSTAAALYTVPSAEVGIISKLTLFNSGTTAETVKLYVLQESGDTAGAANQAVEKVIGAKSDEPINLSAINLAPGASLHGESTTANTVTWQLSLTLRTQSAAATGSTVGF